ncbi:protein-tyrosine phosphatase family protein [Spirosoma endophyticum]|uniref:Dual specificity phosphatase, catalytic domain n=1 Tax=Spirosoma endophyticum TaxID=662367 RepID=A0A1I1F0A4_9BACT|nr:dual specificity protein phosphatase family protein [Spirosoma endophyticum]SFB91188.1 Dual specificity phosphatase, catalytic domain [Spirosoma endophyticum]
MELYQITDEGTLFISPSIDDWNPISQLTIDAVFNLDCTLDQNIPEVMNDTLYIFFPFEDQHLPDLKKLHDLARLGANLINSGHQVLSHCGMGHNRSALLAGLVLTYLGLSGKEAVRLLRAKRQGALYNKEFAAYLESVPANGIPLNVQRPATMFQ